MCSHIIPSQGSSEVCYWVQGCKLAALWQGGLSGSAADMKRGTVRLLAAALLCNTLIWRMYSCPSSCVCGLVYEAAKKWLLHVDDGDEEAEDRLSVQLVAGAHGNGLFCVCCERLVQCVVCRQACCKQKLQKRVTEHTC
jgi:hypothetical protein